jgi:ABC-type branched-subunit amino acid transport system substrate-binding protein
MGFPAIVRAQSDKIIIGHLTPRTGFLGPMGEYAVMSINLAVEEQNKAGGLLGRQLTLLSEDSVNPPTASSKAQRLLERDGAALLIGEISSASALGIAQVAQRNKKLFMNTGCNSDELRGKSCNKFMFHIEAANSTYVKACGQQLLQNGLIKGKKLYALTADYAFGHDLLRTAKAFVGANGGTIANDELVPTDATDFSPYLLKIRQAKPDLVISNLAGNQITNFIKQYSEFGLPFPIAGFGFDTVAAWGAGADNFAGTWPTTWHHDVDSPSSKAFVAAFIKKYGKPPENQAWGEYVASARSPRRSRDQVAGHHETDRVLRERCADRHPQGPQGRLSRLGPPADAGDVHPLAQTQGARQGPVGLPATGRGRAGTERTAGFDRADHAGKRLQVQLKFPDHTATRPCLRPGRGRQSPHSSQGLGRSCNANRFPAGTNPQRIAGRRLLPADRAGAVADLQPGGIVNLAHGAFYAIGAYLAVEITRHLGFTGAVFSRRCWWHCWASCSNASCCAVSIRPIPSWDSC